MPHNSPRARRIAKARVGPWLLGLNKKAKKYALAAGELADGQNLMLDDEPGSATKRNGTRLLSLFPTGNVARDGFTFQKEDGQSFLLASDGTDLYHTVDLSNQASWILLFAGLNPDGFTEFETAENRVWFTNFIDPVMSWDGTTLRAYDREFDNTAEGDDTDATAVTTTTIEHPSLVDADDFWNGQQLVFTRGNNIGKLVTITDYDQATKKLTFTPAITGEAVTDRWKLGIIIPKGRAIRFWDSRLWVGSTSENPSELRFHELTDPNTGADIDIDHPLAWPPENQLDINRADGDRVWGISPVLRDRIIIIKASGIFRIERDPLTIYTFEAITKAIGSRFQRSFAEKKELLYFFGQDKDGFPDLYKTDMVDVRPVDPAGRLEPTLNGLRQPAEGQKLAIFSSTSDFNTGTKSTLADTAGSTLRPGTLDTKAEWDDSISNVNVDTSKKLGSIRLPGSLTLFDDFSDLDFNNNPTWTPINFGGSISAASGALSLVNTPADGQGFPLISVPSPAGIQLWRFDASGFFGDVLFFMNGNGHDGFGNFNGSGYAIAFGSGSATLSIVTGGSKSSILALPDATGGTQTYQITRDSTTKEFKVYIKVGAAFVLQGTVTNTTHTFNDFFMLAGGANVTIDNICTGQFVEAATVMAIGTVVYQFDYTRVPDSFGRFFANLTLNGGTIAFSSFSSDTVDFSTGNDPGGFTAYNNGDVPASQLKQHLRIKIVMVPDAVPACASPEITGLTGGFLWLSPAIFVGANIGAWRSFLTTLTKQIGTDFEIKIRSATTLTVPLEGDYGPFFVITNSDNIGTILGDVIPPNARHVQVIIQGGPSDVGLIPFLDLFVVQWNEGSADIIPLTGIVHRKRYLATAALSTSPANDIIIVNDRNEAWMEYSGMNLNFMTHFKGNFIGFSSIDDKMLELDIQGVFSDLGLLIDAFADIREETLGDEDARKDLRYSYLHVGEKAYSLEVSTKIAKDPAFGPATIVAVDGSGEDVRVAFPTGTVGRRIQRRYRNAVVDETLDIKGETIYYATRKPQPV